MEKQQHLIGKELNTPTKKKELFKMFDAENFCNDYAIATNKKSKHSRKGWVQIVCPFCIGNPGWHGGFNINSGYYNCWRCGNHWLPKTVSILISKNISTSREIIKKYSSGKILEEYKKKEYAEEVIFPVGCKKVVKMHLKYLKKRKFDALKVVSDWGLLGTGKVGSHNFRIIIPIYLDNVLISYTSRDITNKSKLKYLSCEEEKEVYDHKHSLYGVDKANKKKCLVVEGATDVWRFGKNSVGLFGIDYTEQQARLLGTRFDQIFILLDNEDTAQIKAEQLQRDITTIYNKECEVIEVPKMDDPANLTDEDANYIKKELGL